MSLRALVGVRVQVQVLVLVLVAQAFITTAVSAQSGAPLPGYLRASFPVNGGGRLVADSFAFEPHADHLVSVDLTFDTDEKRVTVDWSFRGLYVDPDGRPILGHESEGYDVSYYPTAVCREAGEGDAFYVTGFEPRSGAVIVERWVIHNPVVHLLEAPITDPPQPNPPDSKVVLTKSLRRSVIASSTDLNPIKALAYNPASNALLAIDAGVDLETGSGAKAYSIDIATGACASIAELSQLDQLRYHHSIHIFVHESAGLLIVLDRRPIWLFTSPSLAETANKVVLVRDSNFSGSYSNIDLAYTWDEFGEDGYWQGLIRDYEVSP